MFSVQSSNKHSLIFIFMNVFNLWKLSFVFAGFYTTKLTQNSKKHTLFQISAIGATKNKLQWHTGPELNAHW